MSRVIDVDEVHNSKQAKDINMGVLPVSQT